MALRKLVYQPLNAFSERGFSFHLNWVEIGIWKFPHLKGWCGLQLDPDKGRRITQLGFFPSDPTIYHPFHPS